MCINAEKPYVNFDGIFLDAQIDRTQGIHPIEDSALTDHADIQAPRLPSKVAKLAGPNGLKVARLRIILSAGMDISNVGNELFEPGDIASNKCVGSRRFCRPDISLCGIALLNGIVQGGKRKACDE
jgi:hypothetical protein